jgi:hypothetical protein
VLRKRVAAAVSHQYKTVNDNPHISSVNLADDKNETFLLRWRGRQEGPFTTSAIEAKLATNQIGLLHEIFHDGQWVTLRGFFAVRDVAIRAERQAKEEQERRAREEAEREAKEREEQRRLELLAEERRKAAQIESVQSQQSFGANTPVPPLPSPPADRGSSGLRTFGVFLLIAGLAVAGYFFLGFDTSVESAVGRVNNLGLMADRQNGIIVGIGLGVVGTIMLAIGSRGRN